MERPDTGTTLDALPDALLGSILSLAGRDDGPAMALTCRRWRGVLLSPDAAELWREMRVDASEMIAKCGTTAQRRAWVQAKLAHAALVGPLAASFFARDVNGELAAAARALAARPGWRLEQLLDSLSPARLTDLGLALNPWALPPPAVLRLAAGFPRLASLRLTSMALPGGVAAALSSLAQLRSLLCSCMQLPAELVPALCALTQLTSLEIVCVGLPPDVARLTSLQRLAHLLLVSHEQAPQPAGLAWLGEPYAPGARAKPAALELPLPSSLPTLASFEYTVPGGMEVAGARLTSASYQVAPSAADGPFGEGRSVATLAVGHTSRLPRLGGLAALLGGLLPPGACGALDCLLLQHCALEPRSALEGCPQLAALPALQLRFCTGEGSGAALLPGARCLGAALAPLLAQARGLTALELQGRLTADAGPGALPSLPAELAAKGGLRWLRLRQNYLERLPPGAWLQDLEVLDVGDVNFAASRSLPCALAGAPALRRLCLATNSKIVVRKADVGLLLSLPRLARLSLGVRMAPSVSLALLTEAPGLQVVQP